jgi:tripartite motif-containing protein 71
VSRRRLTLFLVLGFLVCSVSAASAECTTGFLRKFGGESSGAGRLSAPRDVAIDSKGNAWVADTAHSRVQEFNSTGEFVAQFGTAIAPNGIALDAEGNVWVVGTTQVRKYTSGGELKLSFGSSGTGNGQFKSATDLSIDPSGNVWVLDGHFDPFGGATNRVQKFNAKGEYLSQFGKEGTGNGEFKEPQALAIDSEGNILVADTGNNRVQEFNSAGEFVRKYSGEGENALKSPSGIAVDSEGRVWVSGNSRIERFSAKGAYQAQFGAYGPNDGQFSGPRGIAISGSNIWVADTGNDRVQELSCL